MRSVLFILLLLISFFSFSQVTLSGRVIDESGKGVPYASVYLKKNHCGTSADGGGYYRLEGVMPDDSIICRQVNFEKTTRFVGRNEHLSFVLQARESGTVNIYKTGHLTILPKGIDSTRAQKKAAAYAKKGIRNYTVEDDFFTIVEIDASFPGGNDAFKKYMEKHIMLPDTIITHISSSDDGVNGYVNVQFNINREGKAADILILDGFSQAAEDDVIAALRSMPAWTPAMQNGYLVESEKKISVAFLVQQIVRHQ